MRSQSYTCFLYILYNFIWMILSFFYLLPIFNNCLRYLCVVFIMFLLLWVHWVSWIYGLIVFIEFVTFLAIVALSIFLLSLFLLFFGDFNYIRLFDIVPQFINSISLFICLSFPFPSVPSFLPSYSEFYSG